MAMPGAPVVDPPAPALTRRGMSPPGPVSGPSGLSDFDVSPLGMPTALLRDEVRVAFLGRTSTEDQQDPRQSLIRQLRNCKTAIPESWIVVAHFFRRRVRPEGTGCAGPRRGLRALRHPDPT
ncbi:hypothetical protein GCM10027598_58970 [Amycolatopsis oliviviridis]|uniref:Uncharacterized protein n=1 Tax=Amycolatopsis oliviviridis TaxID=1471590 RepID=A0ABQ3M0Q0_9PSEU|nr:hypothetical protein GCM10017790_59620 [Amycolatopsis oliviviridis]